jgi:formylmethanofuran dehydrogenase subunit E
MSIVSVLILNVFLLYSNKPKKGTYKKLNDITMDSEELMKKAVEFHGHACPGLAIGVLAAKYILDHDNEFSKDEELVAVVENDNCSVDALQILLGTTFGKGNLEYLDYGKNNYTFYNRDNKKAVKLSIKPKDFKDEELTREERMKEILESKPEALFKIEKVKFKPPKMAEIHKSIICDKCGDPTMSTRINSFEDQHICIPCYSKMKKWKYHE